MPMKRSGFLTPVPRQGDAPKRRGKPGRQRAEVDRDAVRAALADLDAKAAEQAAATPSGPKSGEHADGTCHECGRTVSGERWYCGQCLRKRNRM